MYIPLWVGLGRQMSQAENMLNDIVFNSQNLRVSIYLSTYLTFELFFRATQSISMAFRTA